MNLSLFAAGLAKLAFGLLVGALGIVLAYRVLMRIAGAGRPASVSAAPFSLAVGILEASSIVALGLLARNTVGATFDALDLLLVRHHLSGAVLGRLGLYALLHLGVTLLVGTLVLSTGLWLFNRLTPDVDEMAQVRSGNVGAALVLSAILVVLAFLTAPGLQAALNGLIPFPDLPDKRLIPPS